MSPGISFVITTTLLFEGCIMMDLDLRVWRRRVRQGSTSMDCVYPFFLPSLLFDVAGRAVAGGGCEGLGRGWLMMCWETRRRWSGYFGGRWYTLVATRGTKVNFFLKSDTVSRSFRSGTRYDLQFYSRMLKKSKDVGISQVLSLASCS